MKVIRYAVTLLVLLGLWLTFWFSRAFLYRTRYSHPWYQEGVWRFTFTQWCMGASPMLIAFSAHIALSLLTLVACAAILLRTLLR